MKSKISTKDLALCALFSALTAVGAFLKIYIPTIDMNFTLQWFFVLLAGLLLGSKRAFLSVLTYLLIGLSGIPVFARGGGLDYMVKPTFGFLLGFALAAYAIGKVCELYHSYKPSVCMLASTVGFVIYYGMGMIYFYFMNGVVITIPNATSFGVIFSVYCAPTMIPDYVLCVLAVIVAKRLRPAVTQILQQ